MHRREFMALLAAAPALGLAGRARAQGRPFTFCSFGGALSETEMTAFIRPAAELYGFEAVDTSPTNYAKIKAMVEADAVEWDLVDVGGQFIFQGRDQNLLEKLDFSVIDASGLDPAWVTDYGVFTSTGATVIGYNTDAVKGDDKPESWKDFWDVEKFPGPRSLYNRFYYNYEAALLAAGVARNEVYPATDEKVKLAFDKLRELKPHVAVWWTTGAQPAQLLSTGEVALASVWSGRVLDVIREGAPVGFTYKDAIAWGNAYVIPRGSPYKDEAMKVINYALTLDAQRALIPMKTYGPVRADAITEADGDDARIYVSHPDNYKDVCIFSDEQVAAYVTKWEEDWNKFMLE